MVKGLTKRVITVRFPDTHVFEQAIFMMREDKMQGVSASDVVGEACAIAQRHTAGVPKKGTQRKGTVWPPAAFFGLGSALTGMVWLIVSLVF